MDGPDNALAYVAPDGLIWTMNAETATVLCLANSVPQGVPTKAQEQVLGAWRTKRKGKGEGTWYDVTIAGSAAYVDVLISDDANQRDRCEFLRSRRLLTFRTVELSAFQAGTV